VSPDSGQDTATLDGLSQLCGQLPSWLADTPEGSADAGTVLGVPCTHESCAIPAPYGSTVFNVDVAAGQLSASCRLEIFVKEARITLEPASLAIDSLGTSYGSASMRIKNDGDDPVSIFDVVFSMTSVTIDEVADPDGVTMALPTEIPAGSNIMLTVRGEGTAVAPGEYNTNGTVVASTGNEPVSILFTVTAATLRVIALPQVLQPAVMRAGESGLTTLFTIYNVDISPVWWVIDNCVSTEDVTSSARYTFSECGSGANDLPAGQSVSITLSYNSPEAVGIYPETHTIRGAPSGLDSSAASSWNIQSQIVVSSNDLQTWTSDAEFLSDKVAGETAVLQLRPLDQFGNVITTYGLSLKATVIYAQSDEYTFYSSFNVDSENEEEAYTIDIVFPKATTTGNSYRVEVRVVEPLALAGELFGNAMPEVEVSAVECEPNSDGAIVSVANEDGNACICATGYARVEGECRSCLPGTQPREDRERGCDQCLYHPGTVSSDGSACDNCNVGLKPNGDYTECIPCEDNKYYDFNENTCKFCDAGMKLNPDETSTQPCVACDAQSAGLTGICTVCDSGKQPRMDTDPPRTQCGDCPAGTAGENGVCELCPPGKHADSRGTACELCLPGRYRNDEAQNTCSKCPDGMISDASSRFLSDCRCPKGEYDVLNDRHEVAPIFCWPTGVEGSFKTIDENKVSLSDWASIELSVNEGFAPIQVQRCVKCPGCVVCDFEYKGIIEEGEDRGEPAQRVPPWPEEYRGQPYTQEGWAVYDTGLLGQPSLPPKTSALSLTRGTPIDNPGKDETILARNVFKCPFGTVCRDELEYRNTTGEQRLCEIGYDSKQGLCATCEAGWAASKKGCKLCENVGATFGAMFGVVLLVLLLLAIRKERKRRRERILGNVQTQSAIARNLSVLARVLPALMGDVRVFIGVYQTLTNMGTTLAVTFPENVEVAIDAMKELVNIDIFSFGAVSCVVSGSFYTKLWMSLLLPVGIEVAIYLKYQSELERRGLTKLPDSDDEEKVRSHLSALHNKRRIAASKARDEQGGGFFSKFKKGSADVAVAEEEAEEHHQRAFEDDRKLRKLFRKLDQKAELQQATIGWSFFVVFLA
jgi:hypothetical protein